MSVTARQLLSLLHDIESATTLLSAQPAIREVGSQILSGGSFSSRPPGDLRVLDLLDQRSRDAIVPALLEHADLVAARVNPADAPAVDTGPQGDDLTTICVYLRQRVHGIVALPELAEYLRTQWSGIRGKLAAMPGSPLHREVIERMPCDNIVYDVPGGRKCVGHAETRVTTRAGHVKVTSRCRTCGKVYTDQAMDEAITAQRRQFNIVTAAVAITRIRNTTLNGQPGPDVTLDQIRNWAARGALTRYGKVGKEQTYDVTEIARLAADLRDRTHLQAPDTVSVIGAQLSDEQTG